MRAVEHRFTGPAYTIGIEEELMIVDAETLELSNSIESLLEALGETGAVKTELMESVCEIATEPCRDTVEAGRQLRELRKRVQTTAEGLGLAIGSAGTHPFALWEDQRIVARPRYRDLISGLQFVARQEIIFGIHVHVGLDDPDEPAVHIDLDPVHPEPARGLDVEQLDVVDLSKEADPVPVRSLHLGEGGVAADVLFAGETERLGQLLSVMGEACRILGHLLAPVAPDGARRITSRCR